ncbi:MAG: hypothetical protein IJB34_05230 [Clostridia bacterium]|nr:hypothetical protein [Clostridia bacterium]
MSGYLLSIIGTVLLCALLTSIIPEGKTGNTIKGIAKLACLLVIIAPIPRFLRSTDLFDKIRKEGTENGEKKLEQSVIMTDGSFIDYYCEMRIRNAESVLREEILSKYSLETAVTLYWSFEDTSGDIRIDKIRIETQTPITEEKKKEMLDYLKKNYCSEVLIE